MVSVKTLVSLLRRSISGNGPPTAIEPAVMRSIRLRSASLKRS
jgi:hypothetical protein